MKKNDFKSTIDELQFLKEYIDINCKKINEDENNKYDIHFYLYFTMLLIIYNNYQYYLFLLLTI